jgi:hypothetical protein
MERIQVTFGVSGASKAVDFAFGWGKAAFGDVWTSGRAFLGRSRCEACEEEEVLFLDDPYGYSSAFVAATTNGRVVVQGSHPPQQAVVQVMDDSSVHSGAEVTMVGKDSFSRATSVLEKADFFGMEKLVSKASFTTVRVSSSQRTAVQASLRGSLTRRTDAVGTDGFLLDATVEVPGQGSLTKRTANSAAIGATVGVMGSLPLRREAVRAIARGAATKIGIFRGLDVALDDGELFDNAFAGNVLDGLGMTPAYVGNARAPCTVMRDRDDETVRALRRVMRDGVEDLDAVGAPLSGQRVDDQDLVLSHVCASVLGQRDVEKNLLGDVALNGDVLVGGVLDSDAAKGDVLGVPIGTGYGFGRGPTYFGTSRALLAVMRDGVGDTVRAPLLVGPDGADLIGDVGASFSGQRDGAKDLVFGVCAPFLGLRECWKDVIWDVGEPPGGLAADPNDDVGSRAPSRRVLTMIRNDFPWAELSVVRDGALLLERLGFKDTSWLRAGRHNILHVEPRPSYWSSRFGAAVASAIRAVMPLLRGVPVRRLSCVDVDANVGRPVGLTAGQTMLWLGTRQITAETATMENELSSMRSVGQVADLGDVLRMDSMKLCFGQCKCKMELNVEEPEFLAKILPFAGFCFLAKPILGATDLWMVPTRVEQVFARAQAAEGSDRILACGPGPGTTSVLLGRPDLRVWTCWSAPESRCILASRHRRWC